MSHSVHFEPALRGDCGAIERWSLYSRAADRWLDVVFSSRQEAEEAAKIVRSAPTNHRSAMS